MRPLAVLGVPSSAASYAAGQELAPAALRAAGLLDALAAAGRPVEDVGDLPLQIWAPDRAHPFTQNLDQIASNLTLLTERLRPLIAGQQDVLVLGGDCTVALAVMAAIQETTTADARAGLLYLDRQLDLNTPDSTRDGALDWMGLAHALDLPGTVPQILDVFDRRPLLTPDQIAWVGVSRDLATSWEVDLIAMLELHVTSSEELAAHPVQAVDAALRMLPPGPLAVHLDVDVLDFTDAPLAENTDGRNSGPTLDDLHWSLRHAMADPRSRVLSIGELNPTRSAGEPSALPRFVSVLASALSGSGPAEGEGFEPSRSLHP